MNSILKRKFLPEIILCDRLIGQQHKVLDQVCGRSAQIRFDLKGKTLLIHNHFGLRKIKINGTSFSSSLLEDSRCLPHQKAHGLYLLPVIFPKSLRVVTAFQDGLNPRVGHAPIHTDH